MNRFAALFSIACLLAGTQAFAQYNLWDPTQPQPSSSELLMIGDTSFQVLKPHQPAVDGEHFLHGASIILHEGTWHVTWGSNDGAENSATEVTKTLTSTDNFQTLSAVSTIASGTSAAANSHGTTYSLNGDLWGFFGGFNGTRQDARTDIYKYNETTGVWDSQSAMIGDDFWAYDEPQLMANGNYIMGGFQMSVGGDTGSNPGAVAISNGSDLTDWTVKTMPNTPGAYWGESSVIVEDNGDLTNVIRAFHTSTYAYVSTSTDNGETWTDVEQSNMRMAATKPFAGTLSTGQNYLISTTTSTAGNARNPLTIALTDVGGSEFTQIFEIKDASPNDELSYPYAVEEDGKLYVVYSLDQSEASKRNEANSLELAVLTMANFAQTRELVAYYDFEGNTQDTSGFDRHGTVTGNANYSNSVASAISGRSSQSFDFDGSTLVDIDTDFVAQAQATGATLSLWVQTASGVDQDYVFSVGNSGDNDPIFGIQGDPADNADARIFFRDDTGASGSESGTEDVFGTGWHHLVLVDDGDVAKLYIDGMLDVTFDYGDGALTSDLNTLGALNRLSPFGHFTGQMDEVALFNYVLSEQEISLLAGGTAATAIPEPSSLSILLGVLGLAMRRRSRGV